MASKLPDIYKLVILGDSGVGKTSILLRYTEDTYNPNFVSTIGKAKLYFVGGTFCVESDLVHVRGNSSREFVSIPFLVCLFVCPSLK